MRKKDIVDLIYYHVSKRDDDFILLSREIANHFSANNDKETAEYIQNMLTSNVNLVPQSLINTYSLKFFETVDLKFENSIYLTQTLIDEINGIKNATNNNLGVNTFLFEGEPGTGKTEACKYLATLLDKDLLMLNTNTLIDSYLGQTQKNISAAFDEIKNLKNVENAIILIDELDAIALDRVGSNDSREMSRATTALFKELDSLPKEVTLIATTNLFDSFDEALKRRFYHVVNFDRYTQSDLVDISLKLVQDYLNKIGAEYKHKTLLSKIFNSCTLPTPGNLSNIIKSAVVFSNPTIDNEYIKRIFFTLHNNKTYSAKELSVMGFAIRDISLLLGVSKDRAQKMLSEV